MYDEVVPLNPCDYSVIDGQVVLKAPARTDFLRKRGLAVRDDAAYCCVQRTGDFTLSARVFVADGAPQDGVFLMVRQNAERWVQLGLQRQTDGAFRVLTRRTDGWSEETTGRLTVQAGCYLQIVRHGDTFILAFSHDSLNWMPLLDFEFAMDERVAVGFGAQSPIGEGCEVTLEDITLADVAMVGFYEMD